MEPHIEFHDSLVQSFRCDAENSLEELAKSASDERAVIRLYTRHLLLRLAYNYALEAYNRAHGTTLTLLMPDPGLHSAFDAVFKKNFG